MPNEAKWWHDPRIVLAFYLISIAAAMDLYVMAMVLTREMPKGADGNMIWGVLGSWNTLAGLVANWGFGATKSSDRQTELLAQATPATTPNVAQAANAEDRK